MLKLKTKIKTNVSQKKEKKHKSRFKTIARHIAIGIIAYSTLLLASHKLIEIKMTDQVSNEMVSHYKSILGSFDDKLQYINYLNNYNYSDEMFKKDQERFNNFDNWIAERYKLILNEYGLSDEKTTKEAVVKLLNEDKDVFLDKLITFDRIYTKLDLNDSDRRINLLVLKIYNKLNNEEYNQLTNSEQILFLNENYQPSNKFKYTYSSYYPYSLEYLKQYAISNDNMYKYIKLGNFLEQNENNAFFPEGLKFNNKEQIEKIHKEHKKYMNNLKGEKRIKELTDEQIDLMQNEIYNYTDQINKFSQEVLIQMKTNDVFLRESFKNMSANRALILKSKELTKDVKIVDNYNTYSKVRHLSLPYSYIVKEMEDFGILERKESTIEDEIRKEIFGINKVGKHESMKSSPNTFFYEDDEEYFTFMK